jgi:hypothetical protein
VGNTEEMKRVNLFFYALLPSVNLDDKFITEGLIDRQKLPMIVFLMKYFRA